MSSTTLVEADRRFGSVLDALRRKYRGTFTSWLDAAFAKGPDAAWREVPQGISMIRKQFADEFIDVGAPPVIEALNPDAKGDIVHRLRLYNNEAEPPLSVDLLLHNDDQWRPGTLRAVLAAAIGAAAALLLFALQSGSPLREAGAAPAAGEASHAIQQTALWIIVGAFGAAVGTFAVVCPPLRSLLGRLLDRFPPAKVIYNSMGKAIIPFLLLLLRRMAFALTISVVLMLVVGFIGLVFIGPKQAWNVLFALAAIVAIVLARYGVPSRAANNYSIKHGSAIDALDQQLSIDARVWSALAAGLVVQWTGTVRVDPQLDRIRSVIVGRRQHKDPADSILRVVEQELRLAPGGEAAAPAASEFVWKRECAEQYETVGVVEVGDTVTVMTEPHVGRGSGGNAEVFQKGQVMRKRTGG